MKKPKPTKTPETQTARCTALHCAAKPFFQVATSNRSAQEVEMPFPKMGLSIPMETRQGGKLKEKVQITRRGAANAVSFLFTVTIQARYATIAA